MALPAGPPARHMGDMDRRALLRAAAALPLLPTLATPRPARAEAAPALSARDRADIARAEAWLNRLTSVKARFLQIAQNGASAEGTAWIVRPGRMRFEYDEEPLLLVAGQGQFFYFDKALGQPTVLPVGSTPLGLLLRENLRFAGDITVSRVDRGSGVFAVTLHRTGAAAEGRLTLVFSEDPLELRQWVVVDAQGQETRVSLYRQDYGGRYPDLLFAFNDPRFREALGIE